MSVIDLRITPTLFLCISLTLQLIFVVSCEQKTDKQFNVNETIVDCIFVYFCPYFMFGYTIDYLHCF
jgi:hypothetical protein